MQDCPAVSGIETAVNRIVERTGLPDEIQKTNTTTITNTIKTPKLLKNQTLPKPVTTEKDQELKDFKEKYSNVSYIRLIYDADGEKLQSVEVRIMGTITEERKSEQNGDLNEEHEDGFFGYQFKPVNDK